MIITSIRERPILFSGPMVRAILDGRKTQTRRIVKPHPYLHPDDDNGWIVDYKKHPYAWPERFFDGTIKCHYGKPSDRLWVRETWWEKGRWLRESDPTGSGDADVYWSGIDEIVYTASVPKFTPVRTEWRKRPSIHMPRWASRITLEITNIRVERLQDISEDDAIAEGIIQFGPNQFGLEGWEEYCETAKDAYMLLWELINGSGSWESNPWVWVVEFRGIKK